jgi:formylglycine-generating enzyme required for sulfatase activity
LEDAKAYCFWLSSRTGKHVRLPTEVEWEKAARGEDGQLYPWSSDFGPGKANTNESGIRGTTPVGVYSDGASSFGVLDCAGNVLEWTSTEYEGGGIVLRGGSWIQNQFDARCIARSRYYPYQRETFIGFRVACSNGKEESVPTKSEKTK